jgi:UDP-glucose 4-epimerase
VVAVVTGAGGFIGRRTCLELQSDGWQIERAGRPEIEIPSADFDSLLDRSSPDLVVHCAGPASVAASLSEPLADFEGSALVLSHVLSRMTRLSSAPRLILISSAAVYGDPLALPVNENTPIAPVSPYGFNRATTELIAREFQEIFAVPATILRVFSAYGEGLRRQLLWDVARMVVCKDAVVLSGSGIETRDFLHVRDVARAICIVARDPGTVNETYNVASGVETPIASVAGWIVDELRADIPIAFSGTRRRGDPARWNADISKIASLGFRPSIEIEQGTRAYARWARSELLSQ